MTTGLNTDLEQIAELSRPSSGADIAAEVRRAAESIAGARGLFVVDVEVRGHPGTHVVDVFVDGREGVTIDDLAGVSRELGFALDVDGVLPKAYRLNVSSPGAERPIRDARQFAKHAGRKVVLKLADGSVLKGTLVGVSDDENLELNTSDGTRLLQASEVVEGKVELPW